MPENAPHYRQDGEPASGDAAAAEVVTQHEDPHFDEDTGACMCEWPCCSASPQICHCPDCNGLCGSATHEVRVPRTPTGWDEFRARIEVRSIIDSYTLTMVGADAEEYVEACADDVIKALLGWPVTYGVQPAANDGSHAHG